MDTKFRKSTQFYFRFKFVFQDVPVLKHIFTARPFDISSIRECAIIIGRVGGENGLHVT